LKPELEASLGKTCIYEIIVFTVSIRRPSIKVSLTVEGYLVIYKQI